MEFIIFIWIGFILLNKDRQFIEQDVFAHLSYVYATGVTIIFNLIVNIATHFVLKK